MLFNSIEFGYFFAVVVTLFYAVPHAWRWALMLVASYVFYMWWNASYAVLIALSTVVDFVTGRAIASAQRKGARKGALLVSLTTNLGLLFTFKYWNFFHESMAQLCAPLGIEYAVPELHVLLPVGISFYTFQTLSYTIDIYRGTLRPEPHFGRFALYVSFFPQLVAGPIERAAKLLPQLRERQVFDAARVASGLELMAWGLFKKVCVGDRLGVYVDAVYNNADQHSGLTFLLATYAFAFQIFCDFSGYSDMAIGAARVLGFDLMKNFERPYFSKTITEFWRRWHISLSSWLRDYLYISLGGNRHGQWKTYRNLMITMLLGGLWHGASANFIVWGALQGLMLMASRFTLPYRDRLVDRLGVPRMLVGAFRMVVTFHLVCLSWVFFRAATFHDALTIIGGVADIDGLPFLDLTVLAHAVPGMLILVGVQALQERYPDLRDRYLGWPLVVRWAIWYAIVLAVIATGVEGGSQFIYFQF